MTGPAPDRSGRRLPRRHRQLVSPPSEPVVYRSFDPAYLELVRAILTGTTDPTPATTRAVRAHLHGEQ